jgi:hypothetical protein
MRTGRERPAIADGAAIIVAAVLLAALTYRLVERPAGKLPRSRRPAWAVLLVVMSAAPFVAAGVGATNERDRRLAHFVPAVDDQNYPGARALLDAQAAGAGPDDVELIPPLSVIRQNWAQLPDATCTVDGGTGSRTSWRHRSACSGTKAPRAVS